MRVFISPKKPDGKASNVLAIGFDPTERKLRVFFGKDGEATSIYDYHGVSVGLVGEMMFADSIGSYFATHVRNAFDGIKLEGESLEREIEALRSLADTGIEQRDPGAGQ